MADGIPAPLDMWALPRALRGEMITDVEYILRRKDTGETWVGSYSFASIRDKDGAIFGSVVIGRDITKRKQVEEERKRLLDCIQREKDQLSALINSIADEVWFADSKKNFTLINSSELREFGINVGEDIDLEKFTSSLEVYRPDGSLRSVEDAPPLRTLRGEIVKNYEQIVRMPTNGELRYRQVNATQVLDPEGNLMGSVSVVRDITEIKKAEKALQESEAKYHDLFETVQEVFYIDRLIYDEHRVTSSTGFSRISTLLDSSSSG
jgi:PAS domain S-box-containing protein